MPLICSNDVPPKYFNKSGNNIYDSDPGEVPECVISQAYYQWVPYIFVMLGLMCMAPHYGQSDLTSLNLTILLSLEVTGGRQDGGHC